MLEHVLIITVAIVAILAQLSIHTVHEGYVGVYWRAGALLTTVTQPGLHFKLPLLTSVNLVQVSVQTDSVSSIPCGTSGGVLIYFDKVEVVNRLNPDSVYDTIKNYTVSYDQTWIFDKIHHELNQFCSTHSLHEVYISLFNTLDENLARALQEDATTWAPGIEIIAVRVTKPKIPEAIQQGYETMEAEKTKLLMAIESQKVMTKEAETAHLQATMIAQQTLDVSAIHQRQQLAEKQAQVKRLQLDDEMHVQHERALADAAFYHTTKEAEANEMKLTSAYLRYSEIMSLANNTKVYFGEKIPSTLISSSTSDPIQIHQP